MQNFKIRPATKDDVSEILVFIKKLAEYEKLSHCVIATEELLKKNLFDEKRAEVLLGISDGEVVGFALFFHSFSTFVGKAGIWLEDLFVLPKYRKNGYGKALLKELARIALKRDCARLEWSCLDWNEPSIKFYLSLNAEAMDEWTTYRLDGENLANFAL